MSFFTVAMMDNVAKDIIPSTEDIKFKNPKVFSYVGRVETSRVVKDYKKWFKLDSTDLNLIIFAHPDDSKVNAPVIEKSLGQMFGFDMVKKFSGLLCGDVVFSTNLKPEDLNAIIPEYLKHDVDKYIWYGHFDRS